jgi:hypothetical protein
LFLLIFLCSKTRKPNIKAFTFSQPLFSENFITAHAKRKNATRVYFLAYLRSLSKRYAVAAIIVMIAATATTRTVGKGETSK